MTQRTFRVFTTATGTVYESWLLRVDDETLAEHGGDVWEAFQDHDSMIELVSEQIADEHDRVLVRCEELT